MSVIRKIDYETGEILGPLTYPSDEEIQQAISKWAANVKPFKPHDTSDRQMVGSALQSIKDKRLYRETHNNFYLYCAERWGLTPSRANWHLAQVKAPISPEPPRSMQVTNKPSCVYFLRSNGLIKIGLTTDLPKRIAALKTASANVIELIATVAGDRQLEMKLHKRFAHLRQHGEWFAENDELKGFIEGLL